MEEKDLLYQLSKGDANAYKKIFDAYYKPLVVYSYKLVKDMDTSRDIVQDVIVNFYEKRKEIEIHTSLKSHLYQSVKNRCINHLKRENVIRTHHSNILIGEQEKEKEFFDIMEETELENRIYQIIKNLPNQCQNIFEMSRFKGYSNQEIADELSISKRTVETQISNALKKLKSKLSSYVSILFLLFFI